MDLQEVGRGCGDWMEFSQDRDRWRAPVTTVMNFVTYSECVSVAFVIRNAVRMRRIVV